MLCILFVFLNCFLISCRATRQDVQKIEDSNDTIKSKVVSYKDTLIIAPKSETSIKMPISETVIKPGLNGVSIPKVFSQKNGNATLKIRVVHDTISADCDCDTIAIKAKIKFQLEKEKIKSESNKIDSSKISTGYTLFTVIIDILIAFIAGMVVCWILKFFKII